ncbi:protein disaggregation chaperone [Klebsiella pneumoniae]|uniref:Protein disaggregation chaperone n=1 Tax=Klebsiella pneumoniae TaxID=573 RepID=A0A2X3EZ87_KLEPN|nr:protein disaggregation chaperone [Klebsiella pneumoniae]
MRRRPYSVILLDEVEKAHPDVFNILLQVLGRRASHRRAGENGRLPLIRLVIMTSNLGSDLIQERFGELDYGHMKDLVLGVVSQTSVRSSSTVSTKWWSSIRWARNILPLLPRSSCSVCYKRLEERGI